MILRIVLATLHLFAFATAVAGVVGRGVAKATAYYNHNVFFLGKMTLFVLVVLLELWPMITLIGWRRALRRGAAPQTVASARTAHRFAMISVAEGALLILIVLAATSMARGYGLR